MLIEQHRRNTFAIAAIEIIGGFVRTWNSAGIKLPLIAI